MSSAHCMQAPFACHLRFLSSQSYNRMSRRAQFLEISTANRLNTMTCANSNDCTGALNTKYGLRKKR